MEWISVDDRMPEEFKKIVVADISECGTMIHDYAAASYSYGSFDSENQGLLAHNHDGGAHIELNMQVTHWMKLPEPDK